MRRLEAWRAAVRIARRDAFRTGHARRRSLLVLLMVGVPVALAAFLTVATTTTDVTPRESLPWTLGQADALVQPGTVGCPVTQDPLNLGAASTCRSTTSPTVHTAQQVAAMTGGRLVPLMPADLVATRPDGGRLRVSAVQVDTGDPLVAGMFPLDSGSLPDAPGEVAVPIGRSVSVGDELTLSDGATARVVGVLRRTPAGEQALATPGALEANRAGDGVSYLVDMPAPVTWQQVLTWNAQGVTALSRAVVLDPPPADQTAWGTHAVISEERSLLALAVVMVVIEVVLLAAPAFAVGIRRQRRNLALVVAVGGSGADVTRIVLAQAAVLGVVAASVGAAVGTLAAVALFTVDWPWWGALGSPLDVRWPGPVAAAVLGIVAAVLAAVVPARQVAREDVVTALAGRRPPVRPSHGWPLVGLALMAVGSAAVLWSATTAVGFRELSLAWAAVVLVVGAVLVIPVVVGALGRVSGRAPLPLRYAAREAVRHRGRTSPAVAAVMATVAGLTALAVGGASDDRQAQLDYVPQLAAGATKLSPVQPAGVDWSAVVDAVPRVLPGRTGELVGRIDDSDADGDSVMVTVAPAGTATGNVTTATVNWTEPIVAAPETLARATSVTLTPEALQALDDGKLVVVDPAMVQGDAVDFVLIRWKVDGTAATPRILSRLPAYVLPAPQPFRGNAPMHVLLTPSTAERLGLAWNPLYVLVSSGPVLTEAQEERLQQDVAPLLGDDVWTYTERGYPGNITLILAALFGAAVVAALVGSLAATGLALGDAQPDFATLAAVGAPPRIRRAVAASQAALITVLGVIIGVLVGLVPGIAVTWPLTASGGSSHVLVVPWLWLGGIVVALPLLTALVAAASTRSAVPMTRRLTD